MVGNLMIKLDGRGLPTMHSCTAIITFTVEGPEHDVTN
jgi:hypothetical protein